MFSRATSGAFSVVSYEDWGDSDEEGDGKFSRTTSLAQDPFVFVSNKLNDLKELVNVDLPESSLMLLLQKAKWDVNRLASDYFENPSDVLSRVPTKWICNPEETYTCLICWDDFVGPNSVAALSCGHTVCPECWSGYLDSSASSMGAAITALQCPDPGCGNIVSSDMFESFADPGINARYKDLIIQSFVDLQSGFQWCPGLGCNRAIKLGRFFRDGVELRELICPCGITFCLDCGNEGHLPTTCDEKTTWDGHSAENGASELLKRSLTIPCVNCAAAIEKNGGCKHVTCTCGYEFCWMCLRRWGICSHDSGSCRQLGETERIAFYIQNSKSLVESADESLSQFVNFVHFPFYFELYEQKSKWLSQRKTYYDENQASLPEECHDWFGKAVHRLLAHGNVVLNTIVHMCFMKQTLVMDAGNAKSLAFLQLQDVISRLEAVDEALSGLVVVEEEEEEEANDAVDEDVYRFRNAEFHVAELFKGMKNLVKGLKSL